MTAMKEKSIWKMNKRVDMANFKAMQAKWKITGLKIKDYDSKNRKKSNFFQGFWRPRGTQKCSFLTQSEIHYLPHYPHVGPRKENSHFTRVKLKKNSKKREEMLENIKIQMRKFFKHLFWWNIIAIVS